jgi:antitoxin CptB
VPAPRRFYEPHPMPDPEPDALDTHRRRLLFRATHRGTFENDLMIGGFVRANLDSFSAADLEALEALLELPDTDLADWLTGRRPIPDDAKPMLRRIRESVAASSATPPELTS